MHYLSYSSIFYIAVCHRMAIGNENFIIHLLGTVIYGVLPDSLHVYECIIMYYRVIDMLRSERL